MSTQSRSGRFHLSLGALALGLSFAGPSAQATPLLERVEVTGSASRVDVMRTCPLIGEALAERLGQVPRGTHDWDKFLTPDELMALLNDAGIEIVDLQGIAFSPMSGLHLSSNMAFNYILSARLRG